MATKALVIDAGTTKRVPDAETLIVGAGIDSVAASALAIGGTNATGITIGSGAITTSFPGPVELTGDVTTVGGTTFQTNATFEGNVTFGNGDVTDTVSFNAATTVISNINMGGGSPTYTITNLVNPSSAQDAATKDYVDNAIPSVSIGSTFIAIGTGSGIAGSAALAFTEAAGGAPGFLTSNAALTIQTTVGGDNITLQSGNSINLNPGGTGDAVIVNEGYNPTNFAVRGSTFGGQPLLYVDGETTGNVGIGTNAPATALSLASGQFSVPDGTVSAPSIAYGSNLDTGFFRSGSSGSVVVTNEAVSLALNGNEAVGFRDLSLGGVTGTQLFVGVSAAGSSTNTIGLLTLGQRTIGGEALSQYSAMIEAHIDDTVTGSGVGVGLYTYGSASSGSVSSGFLAKKARGSQASPAVVQSGDVLGQFVGQGYDGNATGGFTANASSAKMQVVAAETFVNGANNGALLDLYTVPTGSTTTTARLRVGAAGNVGIGTFAGVTEPANLLSVNDKFGVDSNGRIVEYDNGSVTKGDLLAGSAASGYVAVGVGTNGQVLQADSTATGGVSWYTIPAATDYSVISLSTSAGANKACKADGTAAQADSAPNARVVGIDQGSNTVKILGIVNCDVEGSLSIAQGDVVYLSATEAGAVTNVAPTASGEVVAELGIATAASSAGLVAIVWQPKTICLL